MAEYQEGTIKRAKLEVIIMPNDEILCAGMHVGWLNDTRPSFTNKDKRLVDYVEVTVMCDNCGGDRGTKTDYCPDCGAQ